MPIAPPERRLLPDAPEPLEPAGLHPARRTPHRAGGKVHHRAQMREHRRLQPHCIALDPRLALGSAERHDDKAGAAAVDARNLFIAAHRFDRAESGGVEADAAHAAAAPVDRVRGQRRGAGRPAEQVDADGRAGVRLQRLEQVGARHALSNRQAEQPRDPDQRHAIDKAQVAAQYRAPKSGIGARRHREIEVGRRDEAAPAGERGLANVPHRGAEIDRIERQAEDADERPIEVDPARRRRSTAGCGDFSGCRHHVWCAPIRFGVS